MEEINESGCSRPNFTNIRLLSVRFKHIDSSLQSLLICTSTVLDSSINDRDIVVLIKNLIHPIKWEPTLIDRKILIVNHVIDIRPDSIKRNTIFLITRGNIF